MAEDELINVGHLKQSMRRMDDEFIDNEEFKSALREAQESGEFDGVSIVKVEQTTTSTADSGENVIDVTLSNGTVATFKVRNGSKGSTGLQGPKGDTGAKGATGATGNGIKSAVLNSDYTLTLTFTDGTSYKTPVSIRGAQGATGPTGPTGPQGATGAQGAIGPTGPQGVSISKVEQTTTSTADGGSNVVTVTLSNGTKSTFTVKNGSRGGDGPTGPQGPKGDKGDKGDTGATGVGVKSVVQTTTSSADGGDNIITVTLTNGTTSTFTVKNGSRGSTGNRGSQIYFGTKITGTSTTATVFSSSGVSSALVNDMYINTSTWNIYQCTTGGAASAAKWKYIGSIKGAKGAAGTNATINGMNTLTVKGGLGVSVTQEGTELTISTARDYDVYDKLLEHCWARQPLDANAVEGENINLIILTTTSSSAAGDIYYSDTILAENGNVTLTDPQSVKVGYDTHTAAEVLIGKYFSSAATGANVYKIDEAATVSRYTQYVGTHPTLGVDMYKYSVTISPARLVTFADSDSWDYVYSAQRDAYPDSGSDGTFVYEYRGVPIENASSPLRMQYGSYVGTGTYGEENALSLTFDFAPKLLMIFSPTTSYVDWFASRTMDYGVANTSTAAIVEWNGNTVSWYAASSSSGAKNMRNTKGTTYHWVAIG